MARVAAETGGSLKLKTEPLEAMLPPGVSLADGLTEDEVVSMAL